MRALRKSRALLRPAAPFPQTPSPERTPAWCGPESLKDAAGPKSWRGVGQAAEDWGELNTGKRPPAPFVLDLARREVVKVRQGRGVSRATFKG